ncbi:MAG: nicotinate (nicotinamide) nucleotide adenylyltransferase [Glaciecola sp.]
MHKDIKFIYGGTFDPPHYGHLRPLQSTADLLGIPHIELMPAHVPALKSEVSASEHRVNMLRHLVALDPRFTINTIETKQQNTTYTVKTLQQLKQLHPNTQLVFIMGDDSLAHIHKWYHWQQMFDYAHILVMTRPSTAHHSTIVASNLYKFRTEQGLLCDIVSSEMDDKSKLYLSSKLAPVNVVKQCDTNSAFMDIISTSTAGNLWLVNNNTMALSSTSVRSRIAKQQDVSDLVPSTIVNYIKQHQLYNH